MSEKALVGWFDDTKLNFVACYDSVEIERLGALLMHKYNTENRVKKLINKGDIYILGESMVYKRGVKRSNNYFYPSSVYFNEGRAEYIVDNIINHMGDNSEEARKREMLKYTSDWEDIKPVVYNIKNKRIKSVLSSVLRRYGANTTYFYSIKDEQWYYAYLDVILEEKCIVNIISLRDIFTNKSLFKKCKGVRKLTDREEANYNYVAALLQNKL